MKTKRTILSVILVTIFIVTFSTNTQANTNVPIGGTEEDTASDKISELEKEIKELENKISKLKNTEKSLQNEINTVTSEIALTELRISQSLAQIKQKEKDIVELGNDIIDLKNRIVKIGDSIVHQEVLLNERLRERYKTIETNPVVVVFGSDTIGNIVQKTQYLKVIEEMDKKLLEQMNKTKKAYGLQKNLVEDKKEEEESLKQQLEIERSNLEGYNNELENKKSEKNSLLEKTQNDEKKFQELLEEAQRELNQIIGAASVLKDSKPKDVKQGDIIGFQGNTGFSSGEHLHFGVYRYSSFEDIDGWNWYYSNLVDPNKKLKEKTVYWNTGCESAKNKTVGDGDWVWPISSPTISQGYGYTCWSPIYYSGNVHPAYDMYGATGTPVYAVEDGRAYFCKNCLGDGANGVFIFHEDDYMTLYWHLR